MTPDQHEEQETSLTLFESTLRLVALLFLIYPGMLSKGMQSFVEDFTKSVFEQTPSSQISERPALRRSTTWGDNYMDYWRQD